MRVLHLFSNCKWTGPAEPALNLCRALRDAGVETEFACAPDAGKSINMVVESARARGVEPILDFHLRKHRHPWYNFQDVRRLRRYLAEHPFDIVHCHLDNDHEIAARALQGGNIPLVRSSYEGTGLERSARRQRIILQGELPSPINPPSGCAFHTRCPIAQARCRVETPQLAPVAGRAVSCLVRQVEAAG